MNRPPGPLAGIDDPLLARLAAGLEETAWAAELCDAQWRLVWVSSQLRTLLGEQDDRALGIGSHVMATRSLPSWLRTVGDATQAAWIATNAPQMIEDTRVEATPWRPWFALSTLTSSALPSPSAGRSGPR